MPSKRTASARFERGFEGRGHLGSARNDERAALGGFIKEFKGRMLFGRGVVPGVARRRTAERNGLDAKSARSAVMEADGRGGFGPGPPVEAAKSAEQAIEAQHVGDFVAHRRRSVDRQTLPFAQEQEADDVIEIGPGEKDGLDRARARFVGPRLQGPEGADLRSEIG